MDIKQYFIETFDLKNDEYFISNLIKIAGKCGMALTTFDILFGYLARHNQGINEEHNILAIVFSLVKSSSF